MLLYGIATDIGISLTEYLQVHSRIESKHTYKYKKINTSMHHILLF